MYSNIGLRRYRETDISTMSREKIVVLLYEKMVSDLTEALVEKNDDLVMVGEGYTTHVYINDGREPAPLPDHYIDAFKKIGLR